MVSGDSGVSNDSGLVGTKRMLRFLVLVLLMLLLASVAYWWYVKEVVYSPKKTTYMGVEVETRMLGKAGPFTVQEVTGEIGPDSTGTQSKSPMLVVSRAGKVMLSVDSGDDSVTYYDESGLAWAEAKDLDERGVYKNRQFMFYDNDRNLNTVLEDMNGDGVMDRLFDISGMSMSIRFNDAWVQLSITDKIHSVTGEDGEEHVVVFRDGKWLVDDSVAPKD